MRDRAEQLAKEIPQSLRNFTVHDVSHLDALWETADLFAAELVSLNPLEGFVFGAAVLLHDLGLALAAYPDGLDELKQTPVWKDSLLGIQRGRTPTGELGKIKAPRPEEIESATANALRMRHAERAEKLAQLTFRHHGRE
jgi:hypothetical protein